MAERRLAALVLAGALLAARFGAEAAAPEAPDATGWHLVRPGETLRQITAFYLGDSTLWKENWMLNSDLADPNRLVPGQRIRVKLERRLPQRTATIDRLSHKVDSKPDPNPWLPAKIGDLLRVRDGVRTFESSSAELRFDDGVKLQVTEDSLVFLRDVGESVRGVRRKSVEIGGGQADVRAGAAQARSEIEIVVGRAVAKPQPSADGAHARLRRTTEGGSQIMVYTGGSSLEASGTVVAIPRGMGTSVARQGPPAAPVALLAAPALGQPSSNANSPWANPRFQWDAVAGAARYVVDVCQDEECAGLVVRAAVSTTDWTPARLPAGSWFWRVTAVAANGLDGFPSDTRALTVASDRVLAVVRGAVVEDAAATGGVTGATPRPGVVVHLFDGDAAADRPVEPRLSTTTDAQGRFEFNLGAPGEYWVAVDASTVTPAAGLNPNSSSAPLADQTYGPAGAVCAASPGLAIPRPQAGSCFGGRAFLKRDAAGRLAGARHLARVSVGGPAVSEMVFAFSFNAVTVTDDTAGAAAQGSLRQFLLNAAAVRGPNAMRFVPAVPAQPSKDRSRRWTVRLAADLPEIADDGTAVDGRFAASRAGPRPATSTAQVRVGASGQVLQRPEQVDLEIDGAGYAALSVDAAGVVIRNVAVHSARTRPSLATGENAPPGQIVVRGAGELTIEDVIIGAHADGNRLDAESAASFCGLGVYDRGRARASRVLVIDQRMYGVLVQSGTGEAALDASDLEVTQSGLGSPLGDGVGLHSNGSRLQRAYIHHNMNDGTLRYDGGAGVELWGDRSAYGMSASRNVITESTVAFNGRGITISTNAMENVVERSVIASNRRSGVLLNTYTRALVPTRNRITANVFPGNSAVVIEARIETSLEDPIAAVNDGARSDAEPNNGMDAPIVERALRQADGVRVEGYVGLTPGSATFGHVRVELYDTGEGPECSDAVGSCGMLLGVTETRADGRFDATLALPARPPRAVRALAIDRDGNTSASGPPTPVTR